MADNAVATNAGAATPGSQPEGPSDSPLGKRQLGAIKSWEIRRERGHIDVTKLFVDYGRKHSRRLKTALQIFISKVNYEQFSYERT